MPCDIPATNIAGLRVITLGRGEIPGGTERIEEIKALCERCRHATFVSIRSSGNAMIFSVFSRPEDPAMDRLNLESRIYCDDYA